jgi:hypothetical protein
VSWGASGISSAPKAVCVVGWLFSGVGRKDRLCTKSGDHRLIATAHEGYGARRTGSACPVFGRRPDSKRCWRGSLDRAAVIRALCKKRRCPHVPGRRGKDREQSLRSPSNPRLIWIAKRRDCAPRKRQSPVREAVWRDRSSRQDRESDRVKVPVPSIACIRAVSISGACGGNKAR